jgi:hypothetical protein
MLMMKKPKNLEFELLHPKNVLLASVVHGISCLFTILTSVNTICSRKLKNYFNNKYRVNLIKLKYHRYNQNHHNFPLFIHSVFCNGRVRSKFSLSSQSVSLFGKASYSRFIQFCSRTCARIDFSFEKTSDSVKCPNMRYT